MMQRTFKISSRISTFLLLLFLAACSRQDLADFGEEPTVATLTQSQQLLASLPVSQRKVTLSVYDFQDKTGQHKPNDAYAEYSRAVTQGGAAILYKALLDAGNKGWFQVIEREGLENLLQERKIIRAMREQYRKQDGSQLPDVGPMLYAGVLLEGGIISYEANLMTGGLGARYLGIGGDTQYRQDVVTIYLRLVSVQSGEVLLSVNTSKTIYSSLLRGSVFKYIGIDELLEVEAGFTLNEPPQLAVRQAIEMGVYSMVMEGARLGLWAFADPLAGKLAMDDYQARRAGEKVPLRDYAMVVQQARLQYQQQKMEEQRQMQLQQRRQPVAQMPQGAAGDTVRVVPVMPVTSSGGERDVTTPVGVVPEMQLPVPSGADAVQGQAQVPADTQYVPEASEVPTTPRRSINGGTNGNGRGLYDYKVYCTQSGCRAVEPAP